MSLKGGKAGGVDNIVPELLKADPETSPQKLYEIIKHICGEEEIPKSVELILKFSDPYPTGFYRL